MSSSFIERMLIDGSANASETTYKALETEFAYCYKNDIDENPYSRYEASTAERTRNAYKQELKIPADKPTASDPYGRFATIDIGAIANATAEIISERPSTSQRELEYQIQRLKEIEIRNTEKISNLEFRLQLITDDNAQLRSAIKLLADAQFKRDARQKKNKQRGVINVQNTRISS